MMTIKIIINTKKVPLGKLADAELWFNEGPLAGLKLIGFEVWQARVSGVRGKELNIVFPSRSYSVNGERRSFTLLRPSDSSANGRILGDLIRGAYAATISDTGPDVTPLTSFVAVQDPDIGNTVIDLIETRLRTPST